MLEKIACVVALLASLVGPAFSQQAQQVERTPAELEYFKEVVSLLLKTRRYPPAARLIKLEGRAVVFFHVDPDGQITSRRILESSGHAMLDQAALETVDRVNPLPPFPPDLKKTSNGNFAVPIRFEWR